MNAVLILIEIL